MKKIVLFLLAITLISCDVEDAVNQFIEDAGVVKADINGVTKTWEFGPNSLGALLSTESVGTETIYAFSVAASTDGVSDNSETTAIGVVVFIDSPEDIISGATFTSSADLIVGSYAFESDNSTTNIDADQTVSATLHISAINASAETISGTFSFKTTDDDTNITYNITNGSFSEIPYYND
ncbi:DUF6252 family protein [uncultured Winogradskyella sp.]|uniref:DUF6252 family protein n=1 Tax=uncultured Winogradskyella sp. TaxID=395353 RepID=UPI00261A5D48|nr:DUF6252 family protein [uncultured Winogradskyella sp.]|tara:strand:+ start:1281 stop:1820 length:540 start_codon:yes stop_codon:yes gene_type:complete